MRQKIIPLASVLVGVLAFFLTGRYLRGKLDELERERARLYEGAQQVYVVVAANDVPRGAVLDTRDVGQLPFLKANLPDRVVMPEEANLVIGKKTLFALKKHKPLMWSDIEGGVQPASGLADTIKPGMRAISLSVSGANAVSGMVRPNDRVDVLGTFSFPAKSAPGEMETVTLTVLQDVTVLATGQTLAQDLGGRRSGREGGYSTVTLEVTAREAEVLVFAEQVRGRLALSLRHPSDVTFEQDLPEINFEHLVNKLPELNLFRQKEIRHRRNAQ